MKESEKAGEARILPQEQYTVSSLEKIFPYKKPVLKQSEYTIFQNETFHFQVACFGGVVCEHTRVEVKCDLGDKVSVRRVESVAGAYAENIFRKDDYYLVKRRPNGQLYPDLLRPVYPFGDGMRQNVWNVFWVTVDGSSGLPAGMHEISVRVYSALAEYDKTSVFRLTVLEDTLPETDFMHTMWIHYDCICDRHGVRPFSRPFYKIFEKYLESAVKHGVNMLYTPLFTPALDTGEGSYRRTVQLVEVRRENGEYTFDFSRLEEFIAFVSARGIRYIEFCHLATQWGGKHPPKIEASVNGVKRRIFGWEHDSSGEEYLSFLNKIMQELSAFLRGKGLADRVYFHISDEPGLDALERVKAIKNVISRHFSEAKIMDAVGETEFIRSGVVTHPVASTDLFLKVPCEWVYYACTQTENYLSNRLLNMPSQRTRILGLQMYRNGVHGFLHWSLNFYRTSGAYEEIDPYCVTDACAQFPAGDPFIVYPTKDGVFESIRHETLADGFADYRAMKLYESYAGREKAVELLEKEGVKAGFFEYRRSAKWHISFRRKLNKMIMQAKKQAGK